MLVPKRMKIHNYSYIADIELELDGGIYFITGENRDEILQESNGAGKSLFCSTIVWALFEHILRRGVKVDDIIGPSDDHTMVEIDFDVEGTQVTVTRYRNHPDNGNKVFLVVDGVDQTQHTKAETVKEIEKRLGVNKDILYYCAYSHDSGEPLVALTSSQLNKVVSDIINTSRYDTWTKEARSLKREIESTQEVVRKEMVLYTANIESCEKDIDNYEAQLDQFVDSQSSKISDIESEISAVKEETEEFEELLEGEDAVREEHESLKSAANRVESFHKQMKRSQRKRDVLEEKLDKLIRRYDKAESNRDSAKEKLDNLTKNPSGKCDVCGNNLSDSDTLEEKALAYQEELNFEEAKRIKLEVEVRGARDAVNNIKKGIKEIQEHIDERRDDLARYHKLDKKIAAYERAREFKEKCSLRLTKLKGSLKKAKGETPEAIRKGLDDKRQQLEDQQNLFDGAQETFDNLLKDLQAVHDLEAGIKRVKASRYNSFILELQDTINEYLQQMTENDYHCKLEKDGDELGLVFTSASKNGKYFHYDVFSRGERARISKAASTALNTMMNLGFIVDDEGLDGLDDPGIDAVLEFILKANEGKVLFFVGHQKAVYDFFDGHVNLHMIKEDGVTRLEKRNV